MKHGNRQFERIIGNAPVTLLVRFGSESLLKDPAPVNK